ncbi:type II secretion system F family protein, partial [Escherichia coli]
MALFHYQASDIHGRKRRGVLEADSARHARQLLREQALIPVRLEEKQLHHQHSPRSILRFRPRGVSSAELALLTRQLSTLVAASLPLEEALDALSRQSEKPRQRDLIAAVRARVLEGHSLATAMGMFPGTFERLYCA